MVTWQRLLKHIQQIIIVQRTFVNDVFPQKSASQVSVGFVVSEITTRINILWESFLYKDDSIVNN